MEMAIRVQELDEVVGISLWANTFRKGMNPSGPQLAMDNRAYRDFFVFDFETKVNTDFKSAVLLLKFDFVSYPFKIP